MKKKKNQGSFKQIHGLENSPYNTSWKKISWWKNEQNVPYHGENFLQKFYKAEKTETCQSH